MKRCKDCKYWSRTSNIIDDPNPSGKCNGRYNGKHEGYGTHAHQSICYDFVEGKNATHIRRWKFWRPK